jgi:two-component system phosphate regulon sensor histidine kinase PhoR
LDRLAENLSGSLDTLRAERDVLSGILSSMQEGVLVVDTDRRIVLINPALRDMLLVGEDAIGRNVLHVVRNAALNQLLESAAQGTTRELELELAGLRPRRMLARSVPLHEAPGGVLTVFVDVTELRRLEAVRRDFVANASHELRSPLTTIRAAVETLRTVKDDAQASTRFIELIERNAERIENLVGDLLEIARLESSDLDLHLEALNLSGAVNRILSRHAARAELKKIALVNGVSNDTEVKADARALDHVLGNLVDNAIKYCPPGAAISISDRREEAHVLVAVTDTGPGMSIVKHLTEAMGGSVAVRSESGAGATFTFTLRRS